MTEKQYTSDRDSRLRKLNRELAFAVSGLVVLIDHLKELLTSLGEGANLGRPVEAGPTDEAEMKNPGADDAIGLGMKSPGAGHLAVDGPEIGEPDADNLHIMRRDWL